MTKKLIWLAIVVILCICVKHAFAMGEVMTVTKENQAKLGLKFTLVADRVDDQAVLVSMEIQRTGKLKDLRTINMRIGEGRPIVDATLQTKPGKNGSWIVSFQISPEIADKCCVDLIVPTEPLTYLDYAVELKGYVTTRK